MLLSATFLQDYRCFKQGESFTFRPGVNLLVGDQGSGKSTLLELIRYGGTPRWGKESILDLVMDGPTQSFCKDFEKENPRVSEEFIKRNDGLSFAAKIVSRWGSHGEMVQRLLRTIRETDLDKPTTFIMDEPDMALSIRSVSGLIETLNGIKAPHQVLASVHHPYVIESQGEVYSLEHRKWMPSSDFIESQRTNP